MPALFFGCNVAKTKKVDPGKENGLLHRTGFKVQKNATEDGYFFHLQIENKLVDGTQACTNLAPEELVGMGELLKCLSHALNSGLPSEKVIETLSNVLKFVSKYDVSSKGDYKSKGLQVAKDPVYYYLYEQVEKQDKLKVMPDYATRKIPRIADDRTPQK